MKANKGNKNNVKKSSPIGLLSYIRAVKDKAKVRTIMIYENHFNLFFEKQRPKVKEKIIWTFDLIETLSYVPDIYLKHLEGTNGLYEIRVEQRGDIFRIFCFFDKGKLIILTHGFQKKSQKTPRQEIEKALKIKNKYYAEKEKSDEANNA